MNGDVLVVEDDVVSRMILCRMLQQMDLNPVAASSVQEALEVAGKGDFRLVISDFMLPDGTGLELLEKLPALGRQSAPFILVTSVGTAVMENDGGQHKVDGYLTKPMHSRELRAIVKKVCGDES
ncbi:MULTISPECIES: response regulator [Actinoplanes]|uniref:response regulator n=1 Tax=Actinoplanes TaxID=1865 RepID=UPI001FE02D4F|nr:MULTISPECIES: response regulator [Actinoplanes]